MKRVLKKILRKPIYTVIDLLNSSPNLLDQNLKLKNKYDGERAFLILTGESLCYTDLTKLKDEFTFSTSYIYLHKDINNIKIKFYQSPGLYRYCNWDDAQFPSNLLKRDDVSPFRLFWESVSKYLADNGTIVFLPNQYYNYFNKEGIFNSKQELYFIKRINNFLDIKDPELKDIDLTKRFSNIPSSIFTNILIMIYMGFKKIYLLGAGYTYNPVYELHFYDNYIFPKSIGKEKAEYLAKKKVIKHNIQKKTNIRYYGLFEDNFFYRGIYIREGDESNYSDHKRINDFALSNGVDIINVIPQGFESRTYKWISYEEFNNLLNISAI